MTPSKSCGAGAFESLAVQDVLAYYPAAASTVIISGNGDGSVLQSQFSGNEWTVSAGTFTDNLGLNPIQLATAGNSAGQSLAYPDLIAISGDATNGYYLDYYPNQNGIGGYPLADQLTAVNGPRRHHELESMDHRQRATTHRYRHVPVEQDHRRAVVVDQPRAHA